MRLLFVINPTSGGVTKEAWEAGISEYFKDSTSSYDWYQMTGEGDAGSLKYWMAKLQPDRVVAVGGDGTLKFVAEQLMYTDIPVAFLPAGSANGMARELGLPKTIPEGLALVTEGHAQAMDVVRINDEQISLHLSDLGMNAQLVKYFEQAGGRGMWGYVREVLKVLTRKERINLKLEIDGTRLERAAWMVCIANARLYGTGVAINPEGSVRDGRFEVVLLKQLSFFEILKMALKNRRFNKKKVEVFSCERASVHADKSVYFQVDGEYIGQRRDLHCVIEQGAVAMVMPASPGR